MTCSHEMDGERGTPSTSAKNGNHNRNPMRRSVPAISRETLSR
jgi:hypothetical protein